MLAGAILLFINPKLLRDDIGFELSFLAVLGITYLYPLLDKWFERLKIPRLKGIRDIFNVTISAQVFTLPVIAYNFSQISIIAPLANLLVLWILPFLMIFILGALVLSLVFPVWSVLFFLPSFLILKYIIFIAVLLTGVPYSYVAVDYFWWGWIGVYYFFMSWVVKYFKKEKFA